MYVVIKFMSSFPSNQDKAYRVLACGIHAKRVEFVNFEVFGS
jgi:hypothetical protein